MSRARHREDSFTSLGFFEDVDAAGVIPVSLIRWQLTGKDDELKAMLSNP